MITASRSLVLFAATCGDHLRRDQHVERARRDGSLAETTLAAADARIDTLLAAAPTHTPRLLDPEMLAEHARLAPIYLKRGAVGQTVSLEEV